MLSLISYCYLGRVILSKVDYNLACNEDKFSHHCNPAGHQRQENKNSSFLKSGKIQDTKTLNLSHDIVLLQVLGWCFTFFHLPGSSCHATKTFVVGWRKLLRKVEHCLLWATNFGFVACFSPISQVVTQQIYAILDTHQTNQPISALHLFNPKQFFFAQQVDHARWKTRSIDPKLAAKQHCTKSWGFCFSYFDAVLGAFFFSRVRLT